MKFLVCLSLATAITWAAPQDKFNEVQAPVVETDFKNSFEDGFLNIKLTTNTGTSCGGYYIFAKICKANTTDSDCCEDEIVNNGDDGFDAGIILQTRLQNCNDFRISPREEDFTIKLSGYNDQEKTSFESFCPGDLELESRNGSKWTASFGNYEGINETHDAPLEFLGPIKEDCCVFPYIYQDVEYHNCIDKDHTTFWCATEVDSDGKFKEWKQCDEACDEACVCDQNGSEDKYCNDDGLCTCKENYAGDRCDNCEIGSLGYPNCTKPVAMFFEDANDVYDDSHKNNSINHLFHHPGDNIRIICTISPDLSELDTITLRHNGEIIDQSKTNNKVSTINNFGKTYISYIIDDVQQQDSGIYTCQSEYTADVNLTLHVDEEFCMTTREQASPVQNTPCIFPFTYKDVEYNNCTDIDHNAYWCATGVDNEGKLITGKWGNCGAFCVHDPLAFWVNDIGERINHVFHQPDQVVEISCEVRPPFPEKEPVTLRFEGEIIDQEYITRSFSYEYPEEYNEIEGEFKSSKLENSNTFENATLIGTKVTYTLENAQPSDSGIYTCQSNYTEDVNVTLHISEEFCLTSTDQAESILSGNVGQGIGKPCIFPFYFKNVEYDSCTDRDHSTFWCPTKVDDLGNYIDNEWANCGQNCQNKTTVVFVENCPGDEFLCEDKRQCIPKSYVCDYTEDCYDGSDENEARNCPPKPEIIEDKEPKTCSHRQFTCDNGQCIPNAYVCDGQEDCKDGSDENEKERNCKMVIAEREAARLKKENECNENQFTCHNEEQCIPLEYLCDGHVDCSDKSDESKDAKCCDARTEFTCDNGECIDRKRVCDGNENCFDKSDENDNRECDIRPPSACVTDRIDPGPSGPGVSCMFPFFFNGTEYNSCTDESHTTLWCPTELKRDGTWNQWGNCGDKCITNPVCECGPNAYHYYTDRCICECKKGFYGNPNSECYEEPKKFTWIDYDGTEELEFFQEETPLHKFAYSGNLEVVKVLMDDIDSEKEPITAIGEFPLHYAAFGGHSDVVKYMMNFEFKSSKVFNGTCATINDDYPDRIDSGSFESDRSDQFDTLTKCQNACYSERNCGYYSHCAGHDCDSKCILYRKSDRMTRGLEYKYIEGYSCYQLHKPALELVKEPRAYHENTPLHNAAYGGHSDIVKYFMDSYEVEDKEPLDAEKFTPLHYAASAGHADVVKTLMEYDSINKEPTDDNGETPMHIAAQYGQLDVVKLLMDEEYDISRQPRNLYNDTPLHYAALNGRLEVVEYLMKQRGIEKEPRDQSGQTPLHAAAKNGHLNVVKLLMKITDNKEPRDNQQNTPLHEAVQIHGDKAETIVKFMLTQKIDYDAKNADGRTPLHFASLYGNLPVVKKLMKKVQDKEPKDVNGTTPFHNAAANGHEEIVKFFMNYRGIMNEPRDRFGNTPLHHAVLSEDIHLIDYLMNFEGTTIESDTDKEPLNAKGETPLQFARRHKKWQSVRYLLTEFSFQDCVAEDKRSRIYIIPCKFPFVYKDQIYYGCTKDLDPLGLEHQCSTNTTSTYDHIDQHIGKCNTDKCINNEEFKTGENEIAFQADLMLQEFEASAINDKCFTSTVTGPKKGKPCVLPFRYKGTKYEKCTNADHSTFWCATEVDSTGEFTEWGDCGDNCKTVNGNFVSRARSLEDTCPCVPRTECPWSVELLKNRMKLSKYHPSKKIITKYINAKVCDASTQNVECCGFKLDLTANPFYKADVNTQNPEKELGTWKPKAHKKECGQKVFLESVRTRARFITEDANLGEFPYMAILAFETQKVNGSTPFRYKCTGSVINKWYVLTAAHCVMDNGVEVYPSEIILGEHTLGKDMECVTSSDKQETTCTTTVIKRQVEKMIIHEDFTNSTNDIALIRLTEPIPLHSEDPNLSSVMPVCLPWNRNDPGRVTLLGTEMVVTGWGQITKDERITEENFEDINPSAKTLKKGTVPHIDYRQCSTPQINEYFNGENVIGKNVEVDVDLEICAGGPSGTGCQGDNGGPLVYRDSPKGSWYQVGIVDWGVPCTDKPRPGLYTRVSAYLPWIESHLEQ